MNPTKKGIIPKCQMPISITCFQQQLELGKIQVLAKFQNIDKAEMKNVTNNYLSIARRARCLAFVKK